VPKAEPEQRLQLRRGFNSYGLALAVIVHLILLAAVLSWHARVTPPKLHSTDLTVFLPKPPPKMSEPPAAPVKAPLPSAPNVPAVPVMELPKIEPVPQAIEPVAAPPIASPAPLAAPSPASAPAAVAKAAPAASAVGSTKLVEDCADAPDRMMVAEVYRLRTGASSVNDMNKRKPVRTVCLAQLNIAPRHMGLGLPGLDISEWFGLDIRFTLNVPQEGSWDFVLLTDDGSILYVDDVQVIDNDGLHGADAVMGTVNNLTKGQHNIRVRYFQGPGDGALMMGWKKSSEAKFVDIPRRLLGRPAAAASAPQ
jgi:hypothetical protein